MSGDLLEKQHNEFDSKSISNYFSLEKVEDRLYQIQTKNKTLYEENKEDIYFILTEIDKVKNNNR